MILAACGFIVRPLPTHVYDEEAHVDVADDDGDGDGLSELVPPEEELPPGAGAGEAGEAGVEGVEGVEDATGEGEGVGEEEGEMFGTVCRNRAGRTTTDENPGPANDSMSPPAGGSAKNSIRILRHSAARLTGVPCFRVIPCLPSLFTFAWVLPSSQSLDPSSLFNEKMCVPAFSISTSPVNRATKPVANMSEGSSLHGTGEAAFQSMPLVSAL
jgi:hypothetical protein